MLAVKGLGARLCSPFLDKGEVEMGKRGRRCRYSLVFGNVGGINERLESTHIESTNRRNIAEPVKFRLRKRYISSIKEP